MPDDLGGFSKRNEPAWRAHRDLGLITVRSPPGRSPPACPPIAGRRLLLQADMRADRQGARGHVLGGDWILESPLTHLNVMHSRPPSGGRSIYRGGKIS